MNECSRLKVLFIQSLNVLCPVFPSAFVRSNMFMSKRNPLCVLLRCNDVLYHHTFTFLRFMWWLFVVPIELFASQCQISILNFRLFSLCVDLVILYLTKAKEIIHTRSFEAPLAKEEAFRNTLTLLILLKNPPGDLAAHVKEDVVDGFCDIFAFNRYRSSFRLNGNSVHCSFISLVKNCMHVLFLPCGGIQSGIHCNSAGCVFLQTKCFALRKNCYFVVMQDCPLWNAEMKTG